MNQISVIVPVYKVEPYLRRCVDSILAQTYRDFELILVDDGSPDRCGEICDEYARKDARVVALHRANGGLSCARNTGLDWLRDHSKAKWVAFVDSDDWIHPEMLRSLLSAAKANQCRVAVCGYDRVKCVDDIDDGAIVECPYELLDADDFVAWCHGIPRYRFMVNDVAWGKLYDRALFSDLRYPERYQIHEDTFTTYHALFAAGRIAVTAAPLYHYFCNPHGITGVTWNPLWLNVLIATREQVHFFKNGFPKAFAVALQAFLSHAIRLYRLACAAGDESAQRDVRAQLRSFVAEHWRSLLRSSDTPESAYAICLPGWRQAERLIRWLQRHWLSK